MRPGRSGAACAAPAGLQVRGSGARERAALHLDLPNGDRRYHLGFRFEALPGSAENTLQRYITQLEMKRRALARA